MSISDMLLSMTGKTESKLGYTTTMKDQIEEVENRIQHFKKTLEIQKKQQSQVQFQIKKLEESTRTSFVELNKEISERISYLSELFKGDTRSQNKEFDYLQMQNVSLQGEQERVSELTVVINKRIQEVENCIGL